MLYSSLAITPPSMAPQGWTSSLSVLVDLRPSPVDRDGSLTAAVAIQQTLQDLFDFLHLAWWDAPTRHSLPNTPIPSSSLFFSLHTLSGLHGTLTSPMAPAPLTEDSLMQLRSTKHTIEQFAQTMMTSSGSSSSGPETSRSGTVVVGEHAASAQHIAAMTTVLRSVTNSTPTTPLLRHHHHLILVAANSSLQSFAPHHSAFEQNVLFPLLGAGRAVTVTVVQPMDDLAATAAIASMHNHHYPSRSQQQYLREVSCGNDVRYVQAVVGMLSTALQRPLLHWAQPTEPYGKSQCIQTRLIFGRSGLEMDCLLIPSVLSTLPRLSCDRVLPGSCVVRPGAEGVLATSPYQLPASWAVSGQPPVLTAERITNASEIDEASLWGTPLHCVPTEQYRTWWTALLQSLPDDAVFLFFTASTAAFLPTGTIGLPSCQVVGVPSAQRTALSLRALVPAELRRLDIDVSHHPHHLSSNAVEDDLRHEMQAVVQCLLTAPPSSAPFPRLGGCGDGSGVSVVLNTIAASSSGGAVGSSSHPSPSQQHGRVMVVGAQQRSDVVVSSGSSTSSMSASGMGGGATGSGNTLSSYATTAAGRKSGRSSFRIPVARHL